MNMALILTFNVRQLDPKVNTGDGYITILWNLFPIIILSFVFSAKTGILYRRCCGSHSHSHFGSDCGRCTSCQSVQTQSNWV